LIFYLFQFLITLLGWLTEKLSSDFLIFFIANLMITNKKTKRDPVRAKYFKFSALTSLIFSGVKGSLTKRA